MKPIKSVLIFSHGELIGDGMIKMPVITKLSELFPGTEITWLTGRHKSIFNGPLKVLTGKYIHYVVDQTGYGDDWQDLLKKRFQTFLGKSYYDVIIDTERKLLPALLLRKIPHGRFISSALKWYFSDIKPDANYQEPPMLRDRLFDLFELAAEKKIDRHYHLDIPKNYIEEAERLLSSTGKKVLMAPGAGGRFKCWPLKNFIELGNRLAAKGITPYYILGPQECEWKTQLQHAVPTARFPLQESKEKSVYITIALARIADASIANDGGVGHILAAGDKDILSLWGPTDPLKSTPNGAKVHVITAQEFGGKDMQDIPLDIIEERLLSLIK